jgi:hypothetical protein
VNARIGAVRLALQVDGRGWFRTSDLSRVKRATGRIQANLSESGSPVEPNLSPRVLAVLIGVFAKGSE